MTSFTDLLRQGPTHAWLFFPSALLLGAMHGLEPGHSKTMMAAFIVAVRGTIAQAVWLGLSAAVSHSLLVWVIAAVGLYYGSRLQVETAEPYFQLVSALIIAGMALWMFWRTRQDLAAAGAHTHAQSHSHHSHHDHPHQGDEKGPIGHDSIEVLSHVHENLADAGVEFQDAHERAHATEIEQRFAGRSVTTGQIILFGITGGLLPCPAAVTVLIICLQLKQLTLGFALVAAFSLGLALTMVTNGVVAAWSVHHAQRRFKGFGDWMRRAPYFSVAILLGVATYIGLQAWHSIAAQAH